MEKIPRRFLSGEQLRQRRGSSLWGTGEDEHVSPMTIREAKASLREFKNNYAVGVIYELVEYKPS